MFCPHCMELNQSTNSTCTQCGKSIEVKTTDIEEEVADFHSITNPEKSTPNELGDGFNEWVPSMESTEIELDDIELASRMSRLQAQLIDFAILAVISLIGMFCIETPYEIIFNISLFVIPLWLLYNAIILVKDGQTFGKKMLKIKIADQFSTEVPPFWRVMIARGTFHLLNTMKLFGLINILFIFRKDKR